MKCWLNKGRYYVHPLLIILFNITCGGCGIFQILNVCMHSRKVRVWGSNLYGHVTRVDNHRAENENYF